MSSPGWPKTRVGRAAHRVGPILPVLIVTLTSLIDEIHAIIPRNKKAMVTKVKNIVVNVKVATKVVTMVKKTVVNVKVATKVKKTMKVVTTVKKTVVNVNLHVLNLYLCH